MFLPKSDVFKDLAQAAVNEISEAAVTESYDEGAVICNPGDPMNHFYILEEGRVRLAIGKEVTKDYVVKNLGEGFGWSSVVGNRRCTARIECLAPTTVLKIENEALLEIFDRHPDSGMAFFRILAGMLGQRLVDMHK